MERRVHYMSSLMSLGCQSTTSRKGITCETGDATTHTKGCTFCSSHIWQKPARPCYPAIARTDTGRNHPSHPITWNLSKLNAWKERAKTPIVADRQSENRSHPFSKPPKHWNWYSSCWIWYADFLQNPDHITNTLLLESFFFFMLRASIAQVKRERI